MTFCVLDHRLATNGKGDVDGVWLGGEDDDEISRTTLAYTLELSPTDIDGDANLLVIARSKPKLSFHTDPSCGTKSTRCGSSLRSRCHILPPLVPLLA